MMEVSYWNGLPNGAVLIRVLSDSAVVQLVRIGNIFVPLVAYIFPGNIVGEHGVSDAWERGRRNCDTVLFLLVSVKALFVAEYPGL